MDFGDDDEDWDPVELEAIEIAAIRTHAATQQERTQPGISTTQRPQVIERRSTPEANKNADLQKLLCEMERLEKLARDKEGELLILKSNIARANNDHASQVDRLLTTNKATRDALSRELESYKEQVKRLQTDMSFQVLELKETKLKNAQISRSLQLPPPPQSGSRPNGFPSKVAFDRADSHETRAHPSSARKRRRTTRHTVHDDALDDFDLAGKQSQVVPDQEVDVTMGGMDPDIVPLVQELGTPTLSREHSKIPATSNKKDSAGPEIRPLAHISKADKLTVYNHILDARLREEGSNCVLNLAQIGDRPSSGAPSSTLAQSIVSLITDVPATDSAELMALRLSRFLVLRLATFKDHGKATLFLMCLIYTNLTLFPKEISAALISADQDAEHIIDILQDLAEPLVDLDIRRAAIQLFSTLVEYLDRDPELCMVAQKRLRLPLCKSILTMTVDAELRQNLLRSLARLITQNSVVLYPVELLDYISHSLQKDEFAYEAEVELRYATAQCIFCIITNLADGLSQVRKSKHVIPRLIRRILREVDNLHDFHAPGTSMLLISNLLRLYHLLLKDDTNQTSDEHWRIPELKAAHLTTMTRILYSEDGDGFDAQTQDLAMDLLEMAVSPEEGNDIYEIMGGP